MSVTEHNRTADLSIIKTYLRGIISNHYFIIVEDHSVLSTSLQLMWQQLRLIILYPKCFPAVPVFICLVDYITNQRHGHTYKLNQWEHVDTNIAMVVDLWLFFNIFVTTIDIGPSLCRCLFQFNIVMLLEWGAIALLRHRTPLPKKVSTKLIFLDHIISECRFRAARWSICSV